MNTFGYFFWSIVSSIAGLAVLFYGMLGINDAREAKALYEIENDADIKSPATSKDRLFLYGFCIAAGVALQFVPLFF